MKIFTISDLHLNFSAPDKNMDVFGPHWDRHPEKIASNWKALVGEDDLVLAPGDISWALKPDQAKADLEFIASLPGQKVFCKGNHDYWWSSAAKVRAAAPPGIHIVHNDAITIQNIALAGCRLWVDQKMNPMGLKPLKIQATPGREIKVVPEKPPDPKRDEKIFSRELNRLKRALDMMEKDAPLKIVLLHYPPIAADLLETRVSCLLEAANIHHCVFGHLHCLTPRPGRSLLGVRKGVAYHLSSCDYLDFIPSLVAEI